MHPLILPLLIGLATTGADTYADDRPEHYEGEAAATLTEALDNLRDYSQELARMLESGESSAVDLHAVHEITYTLENALETLDEEIDELAETLESVHVASEQGNTDAVARDGRRFIQQTRLLLGQ